MNTKTQRYAQFDSRFGSVWIGSDLTKFAFGVGVHGKSLIIHFGFLYFGIGYLWDEIDANAN